MTLLRFVLIGLVLLVSGCASLDMQKAPCSGHAEKKVSLVSDCTPHPVNAIVWKA